VAEALAAVRRELEAELDAFSSRTPRAPRREGRVVRTPIDLATLPVPGADAGRPVFRGDVAPAGSGTNGATPAPGATPPPPPAAGAGRPPRTRPLRAR